MTEPKFTPGPWLPHLGYGQSSEIELYVAIDVPAKREDFKLIAVAPDLYEAAQAIVERWDSPLHKFDALTNEAINDLKAALAKARGESHD